MPQTTLTHDAVELIISEDRLTASVVVDPVAAPYGIDPADLRSVLESAGIVTVSEDDLRLLTGKNGRITAKAPLVLLRGTPPRQGHAARIELLCEEALDSQVAADVPVARIEPGDPGTPGRDVFNKSLPPHRPEDPFTIGSGLVVAADGTARTHIAGRFTRFADGTLAVLTATRVPGDLTSQNLPQFTVSPVSAPSPIAQPAHLPHHHARFSGDLFISGTLRDSLKLEIEGSLHVSAAIDADSLRTGQDLTCDGGILGGGLHAARGNYTAGRDLSARFATGARLSVSANLTLSADLMHCDVRCGGVVRVSERIHGCVVVATGGIHCHSATASAQQPTILDAGSDPVLRHTAETTLSAVHDDMEKVDHARLTISPLLSRMEALTPAQRQQALRLIRDTTRLEREIARATEPLRKQYLHYKSAAVHEIHIADVLQAGVVVRFPGLDATIPTSLRGPLKVVPDRSPGEPRVLVIDQRTHSAHALPARTVSDPVLFHLNKVMSKIA